MPTNETGMNWFGVLFIVVILYLIFCRNGGGLFSNCGNDNGCNRVSNCEVEKSGIVNTAQTQFLIGQEGSATRTALRDTQDALSAQANRIYEQGLQEKLFDAKMRIQQLEGNIFTKEQTDGIAKSLAECCCGFNRRIDAIECQMLKRPPFYPSGNTFQGCSSCANGMSY